MKTPRPTRPPRPSLAIAAASCVSLGDLAAAAGSIRSRSALYRAEMGRRLKRLLQDSRGDIRAEAARALTRLSI